MLRSQIEKKDIRGKDTQIYKLPNLTVQQKGGSRQAPGLFITAKHRELGWVRAGTGHYSGMVCKQPWGLRLDMPGPGL